MDPSTQRTANPNGDGYVPTTYTTADVAAAIRDKLDPHCYPSGDSASGGGMTFGGGTGVPMNWNITFGDPGDPNGNHDFGVTGAPVDPMRNYILTTGDESQGHQGFIPFGAMPELHFANGGKEGISADGGTQSDPKGSPDGGSASPKGGENATDSTSYSVGPFTLRDSEKAIELQICIPVVCVSATTSKSALYVDPDAPGASGSHFGSLSGQLSALFGGGTGAAGINSLMSKLTGGTFDATMKGMQDFTGGPIAGLGSVATALDSFLDHFGKPGSNIGPANLDVDGLSAMLADHGFDAIAEAFRMADIKFDPNEIRLEFVREDDGDVGFLVYDLNDAAYFGDMTETAWASSDEGHQHSVKLLHDLGIL
jgi:hypothetical protein